MNFGVTIQDFSPPIQLLSAGQDFSPPIQLLSAGFADAVGKTRTQ